MILSRLIQIAVSSDLDYLFGTILNLNHMDYKMMKE